MPPGENCGILFEKGKDERNGRGSVSQDDDWGYIGSMRDTDAAADRGTAGKPPWFGCPSGKIGLLSGMYTDPRFRRQGIARTLLSKVVGAAKEAGCGAVHITASDMGTKLYDAFGFTKNGNFRQLKLSGSERL